MRTFPEPVSVRWELWQGGLVRAAAVPSGRDVACLLWTGDRFDVIHPRFLTERGAMRHLRRRVGGGTWRWVGDGAEEGRVGR